MALWKCGYVCYPTTHVHVNKKTKRQILKRHQQICLRRKRMWRQIVWLGLETQNKNCLGHRWIGFILCSRRKKFSLCSIPISNHYSSSSRLSCNQNPNNKSSSGPRCLISPYSYFITLFKENIFLYL